MYIQIVYQDRNYNKTQPVFRALDVLASKCRIHVLQTTLKMTVSCLDAYPIIHAALKIAVVSCSTHQQLFKQQLAPWSVTGEAFTWSSDQTTPQRRRNFSVRGKRRKVQNFVMLSLVFSTQCIRWRAVSHATFLKVRTHTRLSQLCDMVETQCQIKDDENEKEKT